MQLPKRTRCLLLSAMAGIVLACCIITATLILSPEKEMGVSLKPEHLSLTSSSDSAPGEDEWPKVPVPERDPNYHPPRPSWLKADLTEIEPIPGKVAYLTFDDGPSSMTPQVLEVLRKKGATATFFTVHNASPECRKYYKEIVDSGCELALHAYEHNLPKIYESPQAYFDDYNAMNDFLYEVAGIRAKQVRFPGGSSQTVTDRGVFWQIMKDAQNKGIIWHDWNVSSGDASPNRHTSEWVYKNIFPAALKVDTPVILMHDVPRNTYTLEALPWIIDTLRANGYKLDVISNIQNPVQHRNPERDPIPAFSGPSTGSSASSQPVSSEQSLTGSRESGSSESASAVVVPSGSSSSEESSSSLSSQSSSVSSSEESSLESGENSSGDELEIP